MSNNVMYKIVGIGNICIRMFDGHARTLTNVHHIHLRKNFLLLGALKAQGCKSQVQMEVSKLPRAP